MDIFRVEHADGVLGCGQAAHDYKCEASRLPSSPVCDDIDRSYAAGFTEHRSQILLACLGRHISNVEFSIYVYRCFL